MSETTNFYRRPGPTSDLGRRRQVVPGLPADPEALSVIVRGLLIHNLEAKIRGPQLPDDRMAHVQTVGAEAILDNVISLDPGPLGRNRPAERRMIGFCYHFALLHCALLRATGTPARARSGFAGTSRRNDGSTTGWSSTGTAAAGGSPTPRPDAPA
jgi:transglutaminase-like putative cysteine protease